MNDKFIADEGANEEGMQFAPLNFNAEVEPLSFDEWIAKRHGKGTILKEPIDDWIVTLSFTGIGRVLSRLSQLDAFLRPVEKVGLNWK